MTQPLSEQGSRRLLVTGASGFLGWQVCRLALGSSQWQVYGTYHHHPVTLAGATCTAINLMDAPALVDWLQSLAPDAIIHTAALSKPNQCEQEPELSYQMNVEVTRNLVEYCAKRQIPFVFTSTDQVFDGKAAPYRETDSPSPINLYGQHKAEAEQLIHNLYPNAAICRMPLMYGPPSPVAICFLQDFLRVLEASKPLQLFTDEFRSPAYVEDAASGLLLVLEKGTGTFHLSGPERLSRYDFGLQIADIFGFDRALIVPSQQADVAMPAARPADVSSVNQRASDLGYRPRGVTEGLLAVKEEAR